MIDGKTDRHLWSETYDRTLEDIFVIQSEIAQLVALSLQAEISPEALKSIESRPTTNMEAYNLWLEGNFILPPDSGSFQTAMDYWKKALELDPEFAPAYASLGDFWLSGGGFTGSMEREDLLENAKKNLMRAIELDPDYAIAHEHLGNLYLWYYWDFEAANREFTKLRNLSPSSVNGGLIDFLNASGKFEEAILMSEKRVSIDSKNPNAWATAGLGYYLAGKTEKGNEFYRRALRLFPESQRRWFLEVEAARAFLWAHEYQEVIKILRTLLEAHPDYRFPRVLATLAIAYYHIGEIEKANTLLGELKERSRISTGGSPSFYTSMVHAQMGQVDDAFEWLNKAYNDREVEMYWLNVEPPFEPIYSDPRWQEMVAKIGFPN